MKELKKLYDDAAEAISEAEKESSHDQAISKTIILASLMNELKKLLQ